MGYMEEINKEVIDTKNVNGKKKKNKIRRSKIFSIILKIIGIIVLIIIAYNLLFMHDRYADYFSVPGSSYSWRIGRITRMLTIKTYHSCSYVGCEPSTDRYTVRLTREEYKYVFKQNIKEYIYFFKYFGDDSNRSDLALFLEDIGRNDEVMSDKKDSLWSEMKMYDINNDDKVTHREFADSNMKIK